jgi:hypothetical protein
MEFNFFTWEFEVNLSPHSVTVLAYSKDDAVDRVLTCARENKVLWLCGPYTEKKNIQTVLVGGVNDCNDKRVTLEAFLNSTEPKVHPVDCLIHHTALDG